jgi:hypothetical protein
MFFKGRVMMLIRCTGIPLLLLGLPVLAQQMNFIDLTATTQHVALRYPPALPVERGYGGGSGGGSLADCGVDGRDPRSLTVYLQNVIVRYDDPKRPFELELKVLNTGKVPLQLPVWPHLSDLQPSDASASFTYMSLALSVSPVEDRSSIGYVELYGKADMPGTLITLGPGEWLRVEARVHFDRNLPPAGTLHLVPGYWLRRDTYYPHQGGFSTAAENICINQMATPAVPISRN